MGVLKDNALVSIQFLWEHFLQVPNRQQSIDCSLRI